VASSANAGLCTPQSGEAAALEAEAMLNASTQAVAAQACDATDTIQKTPDQAACDADVPQRSASPSNSPVPHASPPTAIGSAAKGLAHSLDYAKAPVPRMSNNFARRHGLNPKDNPLLNLQMLQQMGQSPQGDRAVKVSWAVSACVSLCESTARVRKGARAHVCVKALPHAPVITLLWVVCMWALNRGKPSQLPPSHPTAPCLHLCIIH
jgi:hypothetical protein